MRLPLVLALLLCSTTVLAQSSSERVFEDARHWTVQIRNSVDRAFAEDEQGAFQGAGLVIDAKRGWVLTNAHVASHSYSHISIIFDGAQPMQGQRIYVDPYLDLAVVAYDPKALSRTPPEPALECSHIPAVGHAVGAFGHPWGFRFTGTRGIASAVTSRLGPAMLQTDAPINAGNSGGPLISLETGKIVGINAAKIDDESVEGLSFAVPMPYACTIINLLKAGHDPSPPASLVSFASDEDEERTLFVARSRLPAGSLDLRPGDLLLAAGVPVRAIATQTDLVDALRGHLNELTLQVQRDGQDVTVHGRWPAAPMITERQGLWISGALFAESDALTSGLFAGVADLMVHHVEPGSAAEANSIAPIDLLISADGQPVHSLAALDALARSAAREERSLSLLLMRISSVGDEIFGYQQRSLDPSEIELVGPEATVARAERRQGADRREENSETSLARR